MQINHRVLSLLFAFAVGLSVSYCSYQWITDPDRAERRAVEEGVVRESRRILESYVADTGGIEISDALSRVREAGKVYVFPLADGWELSGQYRRTSEDKWHAYLMTLDRDVRLVSLSIADEDPALQEQAAEDSKLMVSP